MVKTDLLGRESAEKILLTKLHEAVAGEFEGMGMETCGGKGKTAMPGFGSVAGCVERGTLTQILRRMLGFGGPFVEFVCGASKAAWIRWQNQEKESCLPLLLFFSMQ